MKWIKTPQAYLVHSHCEGNDGTNLGWVAELADSGKMTYQAWICNGYDGATELGNNHKTPRLAQMAVERELLKGWFRYEWERHDIANVLFTNNGTNWLSTWDSCIFTTEKPAMLALAKRKFLNKL